MRREELDSADRGGMLQLLRAHFDGVTLARFEADLVEKNWVLLLEEAGRLRGFSTLLMYRREYRGESLDVVYSGDTIMERGSWGTSALPRYWIEAVDTLRASNGGGRLFWLLLTSGFRTYRFLPVFWREFHPRHDTPAPEVTRALIDFLADDRLGRQYLRERGIARLSAPQVLSADLRSIPRGKLRDPHVSFFLKRNPGWIQGDEMVCLTEISPENLTPAGKRLWPQAAGERALQEATT